MITLYRFPYSCYALKVQLLLQHLKLPYQVKDVPFGDRSELVAVTGGRVIVPAIKHEREDGTEKVVVESRDICRYLLGLTPNNLAPPNLQALIWAFNDWADTTLEDPLFKIVTPEIAARFENDTDRAMFIFVKERRYGSGCADTWAKQKPELLKQIQHLMTDTLLSIAHQGFVAAEQVTMADIALVGHLSMVEWAAPEVIEAIDPLLPSYMERVRS